MSIERGMQFIEQEQLLDNKPKVYIIAQTAESGIEAQEKVERKGGMRLTNIMRESIIGKVYDFKFKKSGEKLDAQELRLSHRAMVQCFGKTALDQLTKIGPPYAYVGHNSDGTKMNDKQLEAWKGEKVVFRVGTLGYQIALYAKDPLPQNHSYCRNQHYTVKDGALSDEIVAWQQACEQWSKEKREMAAKVNAVLNSVTTYNSLEKTWPDGSRFYKHLPIDFPFRNQVPAVRVEELNTALGL